MLRLLTSNSRRQQFFTLLIFFASYLWYRVFSTSVLPPYYLNQGISYQQMALGSVFAFLSAAIIVVVLSRIRSLISWRLALLCYVCFLFLVIYLSSPWQFYLAHVFVGLAIILFWVPYNIVHYKLTPKHRTGYSSAILFSIPPLVSLIAPLLAGFLAQIDYKYIWIFSFLFFLIPVYLSKFQKNILIKFNFKASLQEIKSTRILFFLQAIWEAVIFSVIPIFSLFFIKSPAKYGIYLAYLSLMAILANLTLGHITDKLQKRTIFLYPLTIILAITTLLFPLALKNITWWIIITGIIQFIVPLFWNMVTSMVVDVHQNLNRAFIGREFVLSVGRAIGIFAVFINFYFQSPPTYIFYFLGGIMLLFPIVLFYNTKISKRYNYL